MATARANTDDLLTLLQIRPDDQALRARAADALARAGRAAESVDVLQRGLINLTAHGGEPLPCLCKRCIEPATATASAGGLTFHRDFVTGEGRVLYFWMPADLLDDRERVRRSVQQALKQRLATSARRRRG